LPVLSIVWACATAPTVPYALETSPLALLPAGGAGIDDQRGRFREISIPPRARDAPSPLDRKAVVRACLWAFIRVGLRQLVMARTPHLSGFGPDEQAPQKPQLVALVIGSMIGEGVFNLPSDISKAAAPGAIAWLPPADSQRAAAARVGQPTFWAMSSGSVPPRARHIGEAAVQESVDLLLKVVPAEEGHREKRHPMIIEVGDAFWPPHGLPQPFPG
jgi:hypothetical protein